MLRLSASLLRQASPHQQYLVVIVLLTLGALLPAIHAGVQGPWFLDSDKLIPITEHVSGNDVEVTDTQRMTPRPLGRWLGIASFVGQAQLTGGALDAGTSKLVNAVLHVACALLLFALLRRLLQFTRYAPAATTIAATTVAIWTLSPTNLGTAFYAVQRLTQLACLFTILGLIAYVSLRARPLAGPRALLLIGAYIACLLLAIASKDTGINLVLFTLAVEIFFFRFRNPYVSPTRLGLGVCTALAASALAILAAKSSYLDYSDRPFSMVERLLTQLRVLPVYVADLLLPSEQATGLLKQVSPSKSLVDPIGTLFGLCGAIAYLTATALLAWRRFYLPAFGLAFFAVGHGLESTIFPLEMHFRHRNYLPSAGLYLALGTLAYAGAQHANKLRLLAIIVSIYLVFLGATTYARAIAWSSELEMGAAAYRFNGEGYRAASKFARLLIKAGKPDAGIELLRQEQEARPDNDFIFHVQLLYYACALGREPPAEIYEDIAAARTRIPDIEISRALDVLLNSAFENGTCPQVDPVRLSSSLGQFARLEHSRELNTWYVHYYRVRILFSTGHEGEAEDTLEKLVDAGETKAGLMLADYHLRHGRQERAEAVLSRLEEDLSIDDIDKFGIVEDRWERQRGVIFASQ